MKKWHFEHMQKTAKNFREMAEKKNIQPHHVSMLDDTLAKNYCH
jgi:hypothetical protein